MPCLRPGLLGSTTTEILRFPLHKEETEPAKEGAADYFKTLSLMAKLFLEMKK